MVDPQLIWAALAGLGAAAGGAYVGIGIARRRNAYGRHFRTIAQSLNDGVVSINSRGRVIYWNAGAEAMFGYKRAEMIGKPLTAIIPASMRTAHSEGVERMVAGAPPRISGKVFQVVAVRKGGEEIPVEISLGTWRAQGEMFFSAVLRDVSARVAAEHALRETEERYRRVVDLSPDAIYVRDEGRLAFINDAALELFGAKSAEEFAAKLPAELFHPDAWPLVQQRMRELKAEDAKLPVDESTIIRMDGTPVEVEVSAVPLAHGKRFSYQVVMRDITKRKAAERALIRLAQFDSLTELPNRKLFRERLARAIARANRSGMMVALMFLDLDNFKEINDSLGHSVGDEVLRLAARRLARSLRDVDTVARPGGDEFTVISESVKTVEDAAAVAAKVKQVFAAPLEVQGRDIFLSFSIGVSLYPRDAEDIDRLLQTADLAMYHAKEQGRNRYELYAPELNAKATERLEITSLLRRAIERGEFVLHYQPKVRVQDGTIIGVEALIRWESKELGFVSPAKFIPLAEGSGLIVPISEWVFRTACRQNRAWQDAGHPPLVMSVNLSPRHFRDAGLVKLIRTTLNDTGLEARYLELEITEGTVMHDPDQATRLLRELSDMGLQLSVDDFGTGYSSLAYLKRFPVQALKIDRSFVGDLTTNGDDATIIRAVVAMAQSLKLKVVAEGVETDAQLAFLADLGCDDYQGYYFSKPIPAPEFAKLLADRSGTSTLSISIQPEARAPAQQ